MDKTSLMYKLTSKKLPMVRVLLAIKSKATDRYFFYLLLILIKFLGLVILSLNFSVDLNNAYSYTITRIVRYVTTFGMFASSLNFGTYYVLSIFFFLILIFLCLILYNFYAQTIKTEDFIVAQEGKNLIFVITIAVHILLLLCQHLLEFLSFIYVILYNSNNTTYDLFNYLNINPTEKSKIIFILLINSISIVILNIFIFYSFKILNEPFFYTKFPLQIKYSNFSYFTYMVVCNLQCIHYLELFISSASSIEIFKYFIFVFIKLINLFSYFSTYSTFNFYNFFVYLINFLLVFTFFSELLDLILHLCGNSIQEFNQLLFMLICKILASICFVLMNYYWSDQVFITRSRSTLFKFYDGKLSENDLENLYYVINVLVNLKNDKVDDLSKLMNIILKHKSECGLDYCKCNSITKYKIHNLSSELSTILEGIFTNLNLGNNMSYNILFSEYLFLMRKSTLFSYAVLNTYINKNFGKSSSIELFQFYDILFKKVEDYDKHLRLNIEYINYIDVFNNISQQIFYEKKIINFLDNLECLVGFKEKFDNSLKIDHIESKIDSFVFANSMDSLVIGCRKYQDLYRNIKTLIKKDFSLNKCKSVELSYKLYLFFSIFNRKVPQKILNMICIDSDYDLSSPANVQKYFNNFFVKYFSDTKTPLNMIIQINNIFKIKYVSYKLSEILGFNHQNLLGNDMHQLFPTQLREQHKKVLLNNFLIKKQAYFAKNTFAFTKNNNIVPIELKVSNFPNLGNNLQAVVSLLVNTKEDRRNFYFVLSERYDLIALSENLNTVYSINFDLIEKMNINILKLFDISELIQLKFKIHMEKIIKSKRDKQKDSLYSLSHFLFNLHFKDEYNEIEEYKNDKATQGNINIVGDSNNILENKNNKKSKNRKKSEINLTSLGNKDKNSIERLDSAPNFNGGETLSQRVDKTLKKANTSNNDNSQPSENSRTPFTIKNSKRESLKMSLNDANKPYSTSEARNNELNSECDTFRDNYTHSNSNNNSILKLEDSVKCLRDKNIVVKYLNKLLNKNRDIEVGQAFLDKMKHAINLMSNSSNVNNTRLNDLNLTNPGTNCKYTFSQNFKIKINIRKINDAPFFILLVKEKTIFIKVKKNSILKLRRDLSQVNEDKEILSRRDSNESFNRNNQIDFDKKSKNMQTSKSSFYIQDHTKTEGNLSVHESSKLDSSITKKKSFKMNSQVKDNNKDIDSIKYLNIHIKNVASNYNIIKSTVIRTEDEFVKKKKEDKLIQKEKRRDNIFSVILGILLLVNFAISCTVFYTKIFTIDTSRSLFLISYWNKNQQASLFFLQSALISFMLKLNNLTSFDSTNLVQNGGSVDYLDFQNIISERVGKYRDDFANFFQSVTNSQFQSPYLESILYNPNFEFNTTLLTWDNIKYKSTFDSALDIICSNSKHLSKHMDFSNLSYDINKALLFRQYENLTKDPQSSIDSKLLYFVNKNFLQFNNIMNDLDLAVNQTMEDFKSIWRQITKIVEILNVITCCVLIIVIYYILKKIDRSVFRTLLAMFLNMHIGKDANYKSDSNCSLIKSRMKVYKLLLSQFTKETIKQVDDTLNIDDNYFKTAMNDIYNKPINNIISIENSHFNNSFYQNEAIKKTENNNFGNLNNSSALANAPHNHNNSSMAILNASKPKIDKFDPYNYNPNNKNSKTDKKKKNKETTDLPLENESFITNGQIFLKMKHYQINLIKIAKVLIAIIFFIYILFVLSSLITNDIYLLNIDHNYTLANNMMIKFPAIIKMYNLIRLMIMENDSSYMNLYNEALNNFTYSDGQSDVLINNFQSVLTTTAAYEEMLSSQNYDIRTNLVCVNALQYPICKIILQSGNGYNKQGIRLASRSTIQSLNNINKDYSLIVNSNNKTELDSLLKNDIIIKYFSTEDFANVNLEIEFVLYGATAGYSNAIYNDMSQVYDMDFNVNLFLGIVSIILNLIIIFYIVVIFFNRLKISLRYITYTSKKFNQILFEN